MELRWSLSLLLVLCISTTFANPPLRQVASKIKEELLSEQEQYNLNPTFGVQQLQHAATLMHSLWHHGENIYSNDQPTEYITRHTPSIMEENSSFKRLDADDSLINLPLCTMGLPQYNVTMQNTCAGYTCTIYEAICMNNVTFTPYTINPNSTDFRTYPWSQCEVTKMLCFLNGHAEIVNLKETYDVDNCTLVPDSVNCWNIQPFGYQCLVQVTCSNYTNWGDRAWGLQCATDELNCSGIAVYDPKRFRDFEKYIVDGMCTVNTRACAERAVPRNCSKLNITCGLQTDLGTYGGCNLLRMDVSCPVVSSNTSNCTIEQLMCDGVITNADQPNINQSACTILSINCNGNITTFPTTNTTCTPVQFVCNGAYTNFLSYNGTLSSCRVPQVKCVQSGGNCTAFELACPEAPKCTLFELPCNYSCQRAINTSSCVCPDDYTGRFCESQVQFNCTSSLVYPPISCLPAPTADPKDALLTGDRKCTVFMDYMGEATLAYKLNCAFGFPRAINYSTYNFTYWAKNDKISISEDPYWALRYKLFNFNLLFDPNGTLYSGNLTASQVLGDELVWFNYSLGDLPEKFWYARRLYYELSFNPGPPGNASFFRNFVDCPTRPISTKVMSSYSTFTLVIIFASIAVFSGLVGYIGYKVYRVHNSTVPKQKY